jgi:hypothetical protein
MKIIQDNDVLMLCKGYTKKQGAFVLSCKLQWLNVLPFLNNVPYFEK